MATQLRTKLWVGHNNNKSIKIIKTTKAAAKSSGFVFKSNST